MKTIAKTIPTLPTGITAADCSYKYTSRERLDYETCPNGTFELWHVASFGWCIPTLLINGNRRIAARTGSERTYAVAVDTGKTVRIGFGPHVDARVTVYIRKSRRQALQKVLDLQTAGAGTAGTIRDRISTRRAQTALYRSTYGGW